MTIRVDLAENGDGVTLALAESDIASIVGSALLTLSPRPAGLWQVAPRPGMVGALRTGHLDIVVHPKTSFASLLFMLAHSRDPGFTPSLVDGIADDDPWPAVAETFVRLAEHSLTGGVLRSYTVVDDQLPVVRGRIRLVEQITRHPGLPLPLEVRYSTLSADIPENRRLRAAARRLTSVIRMPPALLRRLDHLDHRLSVATLPSSGAPLPPWRPTRMNERYHHALRISDLILDGIGLDTRAGDHPLASFTVSMATVFEDFVTVTLRESLARLSPGHTVDQHKLFLDEDRRITVRPDIVHLVDGQERAVYDAKYKMPGDDGIATVADLYQVTTYCALMGLSHGHLVYAGTHTDATSSGTAPQRTPSDTLTIRRTGVTIHLHRLNVTKRPTGLLEQIDRIAADSLRFSSLP
ncbi:MAG: McrC family protein [Propionibacteriaceae bacterium]|jgi:5-methylcytosine-specific restriction enzyme subunit McrC|nr:McrC family protein [Propionibacteriaceae bacterium]